jgi:hypothetical protein
MEETLSSSDISEDEWKIDLSITQNEQLFHVGSFGMHPNAGSSKDRFDRIAVPRFQAYTNIISLHPEYNYPRFRQDIVPTQNAHTWDFTFESNMFEGLAKITWEPDKFGSGDETISLYNNLNGDLIDMRKQSSYKFNAGAALPFTIFFSKDPENRFVPEHLLLGQAFPNPTNGHTNFPIVLPNTTTTYLIDLTLYDLHGHKIKQLVQGQYPAGVHQFHFNLSNLGLSSGMYLYELRLNDPKYPPIRKKLFIKN